MSSGVEFDEDSFNYGRPQQPKPGSYSSSGSSYGAGPIASGLPFSARNEPAMVRWLMKHHIAKTAATAQGILIGLVIVNIIVTFIVIKYLL